MRRRCSSAPFTCWWPGGDAGENAGVERVSVLAENTGAATEGGSFGRLDQHPTPLPGHRVRFFSEKRPHRPCLSVEAWMT